MSGETPNSALAHAKEKDKNIVKILSFDWEPDHPPELRNSFVDADGQLWEVWTVPEGFLGFLNSTEEIPANQLPARHLEFSEASAFVHFGLDPAHRPPKQRGGSCEVAACQMWQA